MLARRMRAESRAANGAMAERAALYLRVSDGRKAEQDLAQVMARLYAASRLVVNFFQPSFKLKEKRREGAKVIKRYHPPATPCARALAHPKLSAAIKRRLRETYRGLDPVALLAEVRSCQTELGDRIGKRGLAAAAPATPPADPLTFASALGKAHTGEVRATHRQAKRKYKTRVRMPSKLDPHLAAIEGWIAAEPQITALAIVARLAAIDPATFGDRQHSIVQRFPKALRRKAAEAAIAATAPGPETGATLTGSVDGAPRDGRSAPPTAPPPEPASRRARRKPSDGVPTAAPG